MKKYNLRKIINDIHLWLGLISGIILFIICLTGTILVFHEEIVIMVDSHLHKVEATGNKLQYEEIIANVEREENCKIKEIFQYGDEERSLLTIVVDSANIITPPEGKLPKRFLAINPYNGKVLGELGDGVGFKLSHFIEDIHRFLLMGPVVGRAITGAATIIFLVLCFSGLWLWFPRKIKNWKIRKVWKKGFTIKFSSWKRINFDLHNTLGFYSLIPLLLMGFTGLIWSYNWYYEGLQDLLGDKLGKSRFEKTIELPTADSDTLNISLKEHLNEVDEILNYKTKIYRITLPEDSSHSLMIRKKAEGFFAIDGADKIQIDPHSGEIMEVDLFNEKNVSSQIAYLVQGIHVGTFWSGFSKWIYFLACLIATSFPITGTIIWLNKIKSKKQKS